jgi:hypothetical protein
MPLSISKTELAFKINTLPSLCIKIEETVGGSYILSD